MSIYQAFLFRAIGNKEKSNNNLYRNVAKEEDGSKKIRRDLADVTFIIGHLLEKRCFGIYRADFLEIRRL